MARVFISYSSIDEPFVEELVMKLKERRVDVWYAKWEIKIGDSIIEKIEEGLGKSDYLILVLSKASVKSKWVRQELEAALLRTVEKGAFILPILLEDCEIPPLLRVRKYANFKDNPDQAFEDLISVIVPGKLPSNSKSQIAWRLLAEMFAREIEKYNLTRQNKQEEIKAQVTTLFQPFKEGWGMSDVIYGLYIDQCLEARRLLYILDFIDKMPELIKRYPSKQEEILQFLLDKLKIE